MSEGFLVLYEEDEPEDAAGPEDELVLDLRFFRRALRQHVDIETSARIELDNTSSRLGLIGLLLSIVGAVISAAAILLYATTYPERWFDAADKVSGDGLRTTTALLAMLGGLLLIGGTALTAYGRRVLASGRLEGAHVVAKRPHSRL